MIVSIDAEKLFDKFPHVLMITLQKAGIKGTYLNTVKAIYEQTTNSIFNGEKLKALGRRQGCPFSS